MTVLQRQAQAVQADERTSARPRRIPWISGCASERTWSSVRRWTTTTAHFDKWFSVSDYSFDARMIKSLTLVLRRVLLCSSTHRRRQNNGATAQAARPAHVARRSSSSTTRATNTTRTTRAQLRQPHVWRNALTFRVLSIWPVIQQYTVQKKGQSTLVICSMSYCDE